MLFVQHNLLAENANRQLNLNTQKSAKITEKLSSGYKINRAADDAAGLAISEKMRRQVRGLHQGSENINDGIGYVQTGEGALNEVHDILQRINELAVKAASETNTDVDRAYIDSEIQALKVEMQRIFTTTSFNERKIWDYGPGEQLEYRTEPAVTFNNIGSSSSVLPGTGNIKNVNCGVLALTTGSNAGYTVHADNSGIWVTWTGYDGNSYQTDTVKWDNLDINGNVYSFEMSDYFGEPTADNLLYAHDADGKPSPVMQKEVSFTVNPLASRQEIIDSINGAKMSSSASVTLDVDTNHSQNIDDDKEKTVCIVSQSLTYQAAYASHVLCEEQNLNGGYDFDASNDAFLVPSSTSGNMDVPPDDNTRYVFHFEMPGIGPMTATPNTSSTYSYYVSGDRQDDKRKLWWEFRGGYDDPPYNTQYNPEKYRDGLKYGMNGTPGAFKNALTKPRSLLSEGMNGNTHGGGTMYVQFDLTAANAFTYGNGEISKNVGTFTLKVTVSPTMSYQDVMNAIGDALNSSTVLDFNNTNKDSASIGNLYKSRVAEVKIPIYPPDYEPYDDTQRFFVQAGAEAGQHIDIEYECLRLNKIGMEDTNVLTAESAGNAINEVKEALKKISEQRSLFGAYQNRLEHAYNNNENVVENTQSAESLIRDTDIADAMLEYSINNILMQAGVSMLTQANQSSQSILELLQ